MNHLRKAMAAALVAVIMSASVGAEGIAVDPELPEYKPVSGISGSLKSIGSDTMNNMMALWAGGFQRFYPNVKVEIEGKGSSTAPPALIAGTAQFGPMSRAMKDAEIDNFEKKFGYKPVALETGIDMLAVYVHKDNPIQGLSLPQVDAIFSKERRGGFPSDVTRWGQLDLTGTWQNTSISLYGRNSASGTYGFFKKNALFGGDFKDEVKEQPGSSAVVQGCASDRFGIGYSGIGYKTADVKAIALAAEHGDEHVPTLPEFAYSGDYPLARFLYLYVNRRPGESLDPLRREFIRFIFSRQGQEEVVKDGYLPVPAGLAAEARNSVGLD